MGRPKLDIFNNFISKIKENSNGCWAWTGKIAKNGYGHNSVFNKGNRKSYLSHRFSYEILIGKIPKDMCLDHLCRNRFCVNPDHLEVVTKKENVLRGNGLCAINSRKTHCKIGHKFTKENTTIINGSRVCKKCYRIRNNSRYHNAKRAAVSAMLTAP